jgi:hypothetical protein
MYPEMTKCNQAPWRGEEPAIGIRSLTIVHIRRSNIHSSVAGSRLKSKGICNFFFVLHSLFPQSMSVSTPTIKAVHVFERKIAPGAVPRLFLSRSTHVRWQ